MNKPRPLPRFLHINCQFQCFYPLFGAIISCEMSPVTADSTYSGGALETTQFPSKKVNKVVLFSVS